MSFFKKLFKFKKNSERTIEELDKMIKDNYLNSYFLFGMTIFVLLIGCYAYGRSDLFEVRFVSICFGMTGFILASSIFSLVENLEIEIEKLRREIKK